MTRVKSIFRRNQFPELHSYMLREILISPRKNRRNSDVALILTSPMRIGSLGRSDRHGTEHGGFNGTRQKPNSILFCLVFLDESVHKRERKREDEDRREKEKPHLLRSFLLPAHLFLSLEESPTKEAAASFGSMPSGLLRRCFPAVSDILS